MIPVWTGRRILMDAESCEETYLDFEPDSVMTSDGLKEIESGAVLPFFEICAYAEQEYYLDWQWKEAVERVKSMFSECLLVSYGIPSTMAPTQTGRSGRHNLDWQKFQLFRCIGVRK